MTAGIGYDAPPSSGGAGAVTSVAGRTGDVVLSESDIASLVSDLAAKAPLASPTFTGTVTLPEGNDAAAGTASRRTLGLTGNKAMPGTATLDQIANPTAARTMNSQKITGLASGAASGEAVHYGQIRSFDNFMGPAFLGGANPLGLGASAGAWPTANKGFGARYICPVAGTIDDISFFVHASAGNYDLVVFDDGTANAGKKTFLYHKGSTALAGTDVWISNNPALVVTKGQHIDIGLSCSDGTTAAILKITSTAVTAAGQVPSNYYVAPGGAASKILWSLLSVVPFADQTAEASFSGGSNFPVLLVHITPS